MIIATSALNDIFNQNRRLNGGWSENFRSAEGTRLFFNFFHRLLELYILLSVMYNAKIHKTTNECEYLQAKVENFSDHHFTIFH